MRQGATLTGLDPSDVIEQKIWKYCALLREAAFSYPDETMTKEWESYVNGLYNIWTVCFLK